MSHMVGYSQTPDLKMRTVRSIEVKCKSKGVEFFKVSGKATSFQQSRSVDLSPVASKKKSYLDSFKKLFKSNTTNIKELTNTNNTNRDLAKKSQVKQSTLKKIASVFSSGRKKENLKFENKRSTEMQSRNQNQKRQFGLQKPNRETTNLPKPVRG